MEVDFHLLANSSIRNLIPYQPGKPIEEVERELGIKSAIKLASNENPLGPCPSAILAAQKAMSKMHLYPDGGCYALKQALAEFLHIQPTQLTIGNGSENVLEMIVKSYLTAGSSAVISQYAFLTIPLLIKSYGADIINVPANNFCHDIPKMIEAVRADTRIIFIVNPNNPTGTYVTAAELLLLLNSIPSQVLVVLDEAYHEYIEKNDYPNSLELLKQFPNLIVTRTFSKAYGLAALRLGYAVSSPKIADVLNRARLPFNVNTIATYAAQAALGDQDHIKKSVELNKNGIAQLEAGLKKLEIKFIPSLGNFITIDVEKNAVDIYQKLLYQGIIVRPLNAYDMPTFLRVTVGTVEQNDMFLKALQTVLI
jgi:histidinol-phosphate aminotransferase